MNLPNLPQPNFSNFKKFDVTKVLIALVLPRLMNIEQIDDIHLATWPTTCSRWFIAGGLSLSSWLQPVGHKDCLFLVCKSIPLHQTGQSTNIYIHDTLVPLKSMKTCIFSTVFTTFDTINLDASIHCVLQNIFPKFFTRKISQIEILPVHFVSCKDL